MKNIVKNIKYLFFISVVFGLIAFTSCRPVRHIPDKEFLLNKVEIKIDNKVIEKDDIEPYIRQKTNTRILNLSRFHLWVYNISFGGKERKFKKKINEVVGEPPVIYDDFLTRKSVSQIEMYLNSRSYYRANVRDSVVFGRKNPVMNFLFGRKRVKVVYVIKPGISYKIDKLKYDIFDKDIAGILKKDSVNAILTQGSAFDVELFIKEQKRITELLKENGYYFFNNNLVQFTADTINKNHRCDVSLFLKEDILNSDSSKVHPYKPYRLNNISVFTEFEAQKAFADTNYFKSFDSVEYFNTPYFYKDILEIKPDVIHRSLHLKKGDIYKKSATNESYSDIAKLKNFRQINFNYYPSTFSGQTNLLDCDIQLMPFIPQSYTFELEGTNSSGNVGIGGNFIYKHLNIFRGAEIFNLKLNGSIEAQTSVVDESNTVAFLPNTIEFGVETGLQIPKFIFPFRNKIFKNLDFEPNSKILLSYQYQNRPDYLRSMVNAQFGYSWNSSDQSQHTINPIDINSIKLKNATDEFLEYLDTLYIKASYETQFISDFSYSYIFNNQDLRKVKDFSFFRFNGEIAGNTITLMNNILGAEKSDGYFKIFDTRYAQYIKTDFDYRFYQMFSRSTSLVYRSFFGIGVPYGNAETMPFVKKYYSGGANGIRAWQVRSLGPGSYIDSTNVPNLTADIKLELNIEARFDLFWMIKGALFLDAGNIWALSESSDNRQGAVFGWDTFLDEIAVGVGFGFRLDFDFFIFRTDIGIKARDPADLNEKWIIGKRKLSWDDYMVNFGIGYPF